jgi:hypothetical protein
MARRQPPKTGITDWISDVTDVFRPGPRPNEMRQVTQFRDTTRNVVQTGAAAADLYTGGVAGSLTRNVLDPRAERGGTGRFARDAGLAVAGAVVGGVVGRAAVKGVQAGVRRFAPQLMQDVGVHVSTNRNIQGQIRAIPELRGSGKGPSRRADFSVNVDVQPGQTYKFAGYGPTLGNPTKPGVEVPADRFKNFVSAQDTAYVTRSRLGRVDPENPAHYTTPRHQEWYARGGMYQSQRVTGTQRILGSTRDPDNLESMIRSQRAALAAERQGMANTAGVISGSAGGAIGSWQNQQRGRR